MDDGRFPCADYIDRDKRNAFFEGYTQCVEATNLFLYSFKGKIIQAVVNYPEDWHDSKLATFSGLLSPKLGDDMTPPGMAFLGDSAFVVDKCVSGGKVVRVRKSNENLRCMESTEMATVDSVLQCVVPGELQAAERRIRAINAPFRILRLLLSPESVTRRRLLTVCVCLLDARTRLIGPNHITNTYANPDNNTAPWIERYEQ